VDVLYNEAWAALGKLRREPGTSPSEVKAAEERVSLLNQVKFRGFEASGQRIYRDANAHLPLRGDPPPASAKAHQAQQALDAEITRLRTELLAAHKAGYPVDAAVKGVILARAYIKRYPERR
jgi:hypothetical protein